MLNHDFYEQTQNLQGALFQAGMALQTEPIPTSTSVLLQFRRGYAESPGWFLVQAEEFDPEPLSVARLRRRAVWSSERIVIALLDLIASEKWLERLGDDYFLTDDGRAMIRFLTERRHKILAPVISKLPDQDLLPLNTLLFRVLDAASASTTVNTWSLAYSRRRMPPVDAPAAHHLSQCCSDLNAWRDDCHMAAFQPLGVSAFAWEAFSMIWRGEANSAQTVFEQLNHRGYSRSEYAAGLQNLVQRGWLQAEAEHYTVTDAGRGVREAAEQQTDAYFYTAWDSLSSDEAQELAERIATCINQLGALSKSAA